VYLLKGYVLEQQWQRAFVSTCAPMGMFYSIDMRHAIPSRDHNDAPGLESAKDFFQARLGNIHGMESEVVKGMGEMIVRKLKSLY
jgi:hypothetical protein